MHYMLDASFYQWGEMPLLTIGSRDPKLGSTSEGLDVSPVEISDFGIFSRRNHGTGKGNGRVHTRHNPSQRNFLPTQERFAVLLDLENLTADLRRKGDWSGAAKLLKTLMFQIALRGRIETCVAYGDRGLVRDLGPKLESSGITAVAHNGGEHEADLRLIERLRSLPSGCTTIVIGSGDRIFAPEARRLRSLGKRVEAVARPGTISSELYSSVDRFLPLVGDDK